MDYTVRHFNIEDYPIISKLMIDFYNEDITNKNISSDKINKTFIELGKHPEKGILLILESQNMIIGYCLLINFWSNEYGGNLLSIDELYLIPTYRNKGIGKNFVINIVEQKWITYEALQLEVSPTNKRAKRFYEKLGFKPNKNKRYIRDKQL